MKKIIASLFTVFLLIPAMPSRAAEPDMRGVWVSTVYNLDYPSSPGLSREELENEADKIMDNCAELGLNALFFQARPCADSMFESSIFPWSAYLSGVQGQAPDGGFDPLEYFIKGCHERNMELHCWLNPYRVTRKAFDTKDEALASLCPDHPAVSHPDLTVLHSDGSLYFDPGIPAARELILSGIEEIIDKYDVDGIHFDDYFYPSEDFEDAGTYFLYGGDFNDVGDFRRASVTEFVSSVNTLIEKSGKDISFGISPFGIWANSSSLPEGSDTVGNQSYFSHYADSLTWVKQGLVDYIAPQLYWAINNNEGEFRTLLNWWSDAVKDTGVKLYIGQAVYRLADADTSSVWFGTGEIKAQLELMNKKDAGGTIFFRYGSIIANRPLYWYIKSTFNPFEHSGDAENSLSVLIGTERYTTNNSVYIAGSSSISSPLYINGQEIDSRSGSGYFGLTVPLDMGENNIWITNGSSERRLTIYRQSSMANHAKTISSAMPLCSSYNGENAVQTVGCTAPFGAKVSAFTGVFKSRLIDTGSGHYTLPDGFSGDYSGHVLYTCEKNGLVSVAISKGVRSQSRPISAKVLTDMCDIYLKPDKSAGASGFLRKDMVIPVDGWEKGFAYSEALGYISQDDVELDFDHEVPSYSLTDITPTDSGVIFSAPCDFASTASYDNGAVTLIFPGAQKAFLFESQLFSSITAEEAPGGYAYRLTPSSPISGYEIKYSSGRAELILKPASQAGMTVMLDPGHGGDAPGAAGLKDSVSEKDINLQNAMILKAQLESLGIEVIMTREDDASVSLRDRLMMNFERRPDLFVSLHSNSASQPTDASALTGTEIYFKSSLSLPAAQSVIDRLSAQGEAAQAISGSNLYLCRAEFTPSILLENRYMINPSDFEALTDSDSMTAYYSAVAQGIYDYLTGLKG